jgi:hypothetical protein
MTPSSALAEMFQREKFTTKRLERATPLTQMGQIFVALSAMSRRPLVRFPVFWAFWEWECEGYVGWNIRMILPAWPFTPPPYGLNNFCDTMLRVWEKIKTTIQCCVHGKK